MPNQYVNKVVYGGNTLIDLTADTITAADLASGVTAHDKSGAPITGTNTYDSDTSDDTAVASEFFPARRRTHAAWRSLVPCPTVALSPAPSAPSLSSTPFSRVIMMVRVRCPLARPSRRRLLQLTFVRV